MWRNLVILRPIRRWLAHVAVLSFLINFLLLASPIYMLQIYDRVLVSRSLPTLAAITLVTVILVAAYGALDMLRNRVLIRTGLFLEAYLGRKVLDRLHDFSRAPGAPNQAETIRDVATLRNYISSPHLGAIFDSVWVPPFVVLIYGFSAVLAAIALAAMVLLALLGLVDEKLTYQAYTNANRQIQRANQFMHSSVGNTEVVSALGMKRTMIGLWAVMLGAGMALFKSASDRGSIISGLTKTTRTLIQVTMLGAGAYLIIVDNLPPGVMIASTIIVARAIGPMEGVISGWRVFVEARNALARIAELMGDERDPPQAVDLPRIKGELVAEGVYFAFGPGKPVLNNVSFHIGAGEAVGIVGPSGAGKSSLARVLLGLVKPPSGRVMLDGYDISQYRRETLGPQFGYLPQNVEIFSGTVARNICRMQDPQANSEAVLRAAGLIGLDRALGRLSAGFETVLGEQGQNLSGGQRQMIGLARAFYGEPAIVVLDEPDASLDQETEQRLRDLIDQTRRERRVTLLVITHNPSIIARLDRLLLVKDGTVSPLVRRTDTPDAGSADNVRNMQGYHLGG